MSNGNRTAIADAEDVLTTTPAKRVILGPPPGGAPPGEGESQFSQAEVSGDFVPSDRETSPATGDHGEVAAPLGAEAGEEFQEATLDQMAAESAGESAISDLRDIEGFELPMTAAESAATDGTALKDAGAAIEGERAEFFPALAALAPTLISTIGPPVAKAVLGRLSPRARRVIKALPRPAVTAARTALPSILGGARGSSPLGSLLPMVAHLLESAESASTGRESGAEVDATFVEAAAAQIEAIIGADDRIRISSTTLTPWRRICALRITFPTGAVYRGTGFFIGARAVATAGHCVYLHNQGGWARKIEVIPGSNGTTFPFGSAGAVSLRSVGGWVTGRKPECDYGCIVLPSGAFGGRNLGSFGFAAFTPAQLLAQDAVLAGFPGDKPFAELWGMTRRIKTVAPTTLVYLIDTMGGQSGAPVYIKRDGQRYVVGIHNYGASTGNSATRVTQSVFERLLAWSKI